MPDRATSASGRLRIPLTVLATLVVIGAEFGLLAWVYHRPTTLRAEHVAVGRAVSALEAADGDRFAAVATEATETLRAAGLTGADTAAFRRAVDGVRADPQAAGRRPAVVDAATSLDRELGRRSHRVDVQAYIAYVALLVLASVGWMLWFRRLVARHRLLQQRLTEQESRAAGERRLGALVSNASDVVLVVDASATVTYATPSTRSVLGRDPADVIGSPLLDLLDVPLAEALVARLADVEPCADQAVRFGAVHADGHALTMEGTLTNLLADPDVAGLLLTARDVTGRVRLEEQLSFQALHDPLTGLANRRLFVNRLAHALEGAERAGRPVSVLFCDLDDFKNVNDSLGHDVGDAVLQEVADRARTTLRGSDTVARFGGDEFAVLLEDTDTEGARVLAERLRLAIAAPCTISGSDVHLTTSVGLASVVRAGEVTADDLLRNADVAMYLAKDRGKASVAVYESVLHTQALERLQLRADLQRALTRDELVLHHQPTVELSTGRITGFEALVRWQHPTRGLLPPMAFVPLAEKSGLIVALGSWVLREACRAATQLAGTSEGAPTMAVNVAAESLAAPGFVAEVLDVLATTGLPPSRLTLEITESVVVHDLDQVQAQLRELRRHGVRVAIDDFGTGYSSLAYLRRLPVDLLKVDKTFVDRITSDAHDAALARSIIEMGRSVGLAVVAEGVEESDQADWLRAAGSHYGQGYLWSRPVPFPAARALLARPVVAPQPDPDGDALLAAS